MTIRPFSLIGITGAIGHGKSALLEAFMEAEPTSQAGETSTLISQAANYLNSTLIARPDLLSRHDIPAVQTWLDEALPHALRTVTSIPFEAGTLPLTTAHIKQHPEEYDKLWRYLEQVADDPGIAKIPITPLNKSRYRPLLQWLGGYVTLRLDRSLWYEELMVQAKAAEEQGCKLYIVGGVRFPLDAAVLHSAGGKIISIRNPFLPEDELNDPTERFRREIRADTEVLNDGSLSQLGSLAITLLNDLKHRELKPRYHAHAF